MHLQLTAIGNLGREPEMSYTPNGKAVTRFSLATTRRWTDSATKERKEETTWLNVTAFDRLAETASQFLHKGSKVYIAGRPAARAYTAKDGAPAASLDVVLSELVMLDPKSESAAETAQTTAPVDPDNLPF